ncbi:hypothetical protein DYB30_006049 [Aphanomyces astaci]|uniref:Myosin motor domain-containing protein n=3 Tax=Aphanomyces astaci TaxID=112090 RepID=A0A397D9R7_APHAT|nr:hypothetical protein DYB30_006049 [Aphanomyces astaci]
MLGESGSGKTDLAKQVLKYIALVQQAVKPPQVAATAHELTLFRGGSIQPFFLETSRVTSLNPDDANFHIFYALLVGASDAVVEDCQLKHTTPATFAYLGKPSKLASTKCQLCINYLTEKLSAFELEYAGEVQGALYFAEGLGRLYFTSWPRHRIHSSRFKGHVQAIVDKLNVVQPRFVHCLRPRASTSKDFTALDMGVLKAQVQGQLLAPIVTYSMSSIVRTFRGREGVLFEKLKQKYTSTQVQSADDDTSLESFVLKVKFDGPTVHKMLSNPKMALLLGEPNILQALRELSIDPSVIYLQTTDPVLRLFYTELRAFITPKPHPDRIPYPDMPLDDAVLVPDSVQALARLQLLHPTPDMAPQDQAIVREVNQKYKGLSHRNNL